MERKQLENHLMLSQSTNHFSVMVPKKKQSVVSSNQSVVLVLTAQPFKKQFSTFYKNF